MTDRLAEIELNYDEGYARPDANFDADMDWLIEEVKQLRGVTKEEASSEHRARLVDLRCQRYGRKLFEAMKFWVHVESTFQTGNTRTEAFTRARDLVAEIQAGFRADGLI